MPNGADTRSDWHRRTVLRTLAAAVPLATTGTAAAHKSSAGRSDHDDGTEADVEDVAFEPETDPTDLTAKNRGQLIASIPASAKSEISQADLFTPMNVLEAQQNTDRPVDGETGLVTYEVVDGGEDMRYRFRVNDARNGDLDGLTQGHIHHAPRGESDNELFFQLFIRSDLDGSDGDPQDPPLSVSKTLSDALDDALEASETLDDGFGQDDPDVPAFDRDDREGFVAALTQDMLANPREYINNAHTVEFQTEAIRSQIKPADLGDLSRDELIETVLATAGPDAL